MSGLYNIVFGDGDEMRRGVIWGTLLDIKPGQDVGRFRDCWIERDEQGDLRIAFYTRNGGGNRRDYQNVTDKLRAHPAYISDADDDFDSTYATYYFRFPDTVPSHLAEVNVEWANRWSEVVELAEENADPEPRDMAKLWQQQIDRMNNEGPNEREMQAFAPLAEQLREALGDEGGEINVAVVGRDPKKEFEI